MARSLHTIEPFLKASIMKTRVVKVMCDEMLQRFRDKNRPRYYELKAAIMNCIQKGAFVATYFAKLKKLWHEIANYEKKFVCDCKRL